MNLDNYLNQYLAQYNLSSENTSIIRNLLKRSLYIDMYERLIPLLPSDLQEQALSYLKEKNPNINGEKHVRIKDFFSKLMTETFIHEYLQNNAEKILVMISTIVNKYNKGE